MRWMLFLIALVGMSAGAANAATYQTLYRFAKNPQNHDGYAAPQSPLVIDASGAIYGASNGPHPNVYKLTSPVTGTKWTKTTIFTFPELAVTGCGIASGLVSDKDGNLYGITYGCWGEDNNSNGTVFELSPPQAKGKAWTGRLIYIFIAKTSFVGILPSPWLTIDSAGNLYGSTDAGSNKGAGYLYRLSPPASGSGQWVPERLTTLKGGGPVLAVDGELYLEGGVPGSTYGNILKLTQTGTATWTHRNLFQFNNVNGGNLPDGGYPSGGLVADKIGNLYGITTSGGPNNGRGVAFQLAPPKVGSSDWKFTVLHTFRGPDGAFPTTGLTMDASGNLYGIADCGGKWTSDFDEASGEGTIFELKPPVFAGGLWTHTTVYQPPKAFFPTGNCNNVVAFVGPLVIGKDGALYGTANGPADSGGSVFRLMP